MKEAPLGPPEIKSSLETLPGWVQEGDALFKEFELGNFRQAFAFMTRVAFEAEEMNHHPEWTNVYGTVAVRLSTHHAGNKITAKDVELARRIEKLAR